MCNIINYSKISRLTGSIVCIVKESYHPVLRVFLRSFSKYKLHRHGDGRMMELHFLGTASCFPTPDRGVSCIGFRHDFGIWLFDCGEGSQIQIQKSLLKSGKINKIFITHLHGDHLFGLPGLLATISQNCPETKEMLEIFGPKGLRTFLQTSLGISDSYLSYKYRVNEINIGTTVNKYTNDGSTFLLPNEVSGELIEKNSNGYWEISKSGNLSVTAYPITHRIPCVGYIVQEDNLIGKLNSAFLKQKGVPPGPLYGKLKNGESIKLEDGSVINPADVLGPSRIGRKIIILGDTSNSDAVSEAGMNADVIVHESTFENELEEKAVEYGHSTAGMAGTFANVLKAKKLILTHVSQRYKAKDCELKEGEESVEKLAHQARQCFSGEVIVAEDLLTVTIPLPKS